MLIASAAAPELREITLLSRSALLARKCCGEETANRQDFRFGTAPGMKTHTLAHKSKA